MPLFLVSCVCDEGVSDGNFLVVEAADRRSVAAAVLANPTAWRRFLERSRVWDAATAASMTAEQLLAAIDRTRVDGDSDYQLAILPVPPVRPAGQVVAMPRFPWERPARDAGATD